MKFRTLILLTLLIPITSFGQIQTFPYDQSEVMPILPPSPQPSNQYNKHYSHKNRNSQFKNSSGGSNSNNIKMSEVIQNHTLKEIKSNQPVDTDIENRIKQNLIHVTNFCKSNPQETNCFSKKEQDTAWCKINSVTCAEEKKEIIVRIMTHGAWCKSHFEDCTDNTPTHE